MTTGRIGRSLSWVLCAALFASGAWAQSKTTAALTGTVTDDSGAAVPGASVEISSPALIGGARTATTEANGRFRFPEIAPGIYSVSVSLDGFQPVRLEGVTLVTGASQDVAVKMSVATVTETLIVTADAATIDTSSSSTNTNLDDDYLQNLPTGRFQPDVLNLAPGINNDVAYGSAGSGLAYQLDGVDTSDPEGGTAWSFVNYNIVEEVQLVGLGAAAEYGSFTGVVFNSVTKSGGNEYKGLVDAYYTNDSLSDSFSGAEFEGLNPRTESFIDTTVQVGGPFKQDKLWFFISGQYFKEENSDGGPIRSEESPRAFGKLSWQANEQNNVEGWVEWDRYDIVGRGGDAVTPLEATVTEDAPEYVANVKWSSILSENTILNFSYGGYDGYYYLDPQGGYDTAGHLDFNTGLYSVNSTYYYLADRQRNQVVASVSHFADNFIKGDHDFKFGMELERSTLRSRYGFPTGVWFYDNYGYGDDPGTPEYEYYAYYTQGYYNYSYDLKGTIERASVFAQDSWRLTPSLTVNAGVRAEFNQGKVPGQGKIFDNTAVAPRLGLAWDVTKDGKTVLKAHWGRYYEKFVATEFYYANPSAFTPLEFHNIWPSGFIEDLGQATADTVVFDKQVDQPYMDQYTLGIDRELGNGITASFTYINREKKDFVETVSRDGIFVPVTGTIRETGRTATLYDYLNPEDDVLAYRNPPELHRKYEGYMLVLNRRLRDNWQMLVSYVYSKATGNIDNLSFGGAYGGDNAGSFLNTPNSLVNGEGHLTNDPTHQVKLQGSYAIPKLNLLFSGNYTFNTGDTYNIRTTCLLVDGECYDFNQGTNRVHGEPRGARRLEDKSELDLRAEWYMDIGSSDGRFGLFLDVFNVTNQARFTLVEDRAGSAFETGRSTNQPRTYRIGAKYSF